MFYSHPSLSSPSCGAPYRARPRRCAYPKPVLPTKKCSNYLRPWNPRPTWPRACLPFGPFPWIHHLESRPHYSLHTPRSKGGYLWSQDEAGVQAGGAPICGCRAPPSEWWSQRWEDPASRQVGRGCLCALALSPELSGRVCPKPLPPSRTAPVKNLVYICNSHRYTFQ